VHDDVAGEPLEHHARVFPGDPGAERVMHEQAGEHGRRRGPRGVPACRSAKVPSGCCMGTASHRRTSSQRPAAGGDRLCRFDDQLPGDAAEEFLDVTVNRPVISPAPLPAHRDRIPRRAARPAPIRIGVEPRLRPRLQTGGRDRVVTAIGRNETMRQGIDARLATLTTLAKAGQASWCSPEDWIQGGAR
jgi:hypothetical protein